MSKPDAIIDPAGIFQHADKFFRAVEQLHHTSDRKRFVQIALPIMVLSAFASELFFKCLLCMETARIHRTHLLLDLFEKLSPKTQRRLEELWDQALLPRKATLDELDKSQIVPRDLRSNLASSTDTFRLLRYVYEPGPDLVISISDLPLVLRRAIIELKPEWNSDGEVAAATAGQWMNVKFDVSDKVLGCDIELRDGSSVRLGAHQVEAKIFREARTGKLFSTLEMISNLLMKTNTRKQDLIKPPAAAEAFAKGICIGKPNLEMSFTPGSIELCLDDTPRDVRRIVFDVEVTVRPHKHTIS